MFYIPARLAADYRVAAGAFAAERVCAELAVPAIMGLITDSANDFQVCHGFMLFILPEYGGEDPSTACRRP